MDILINRGDFTEELITLLLEKDHSTDNTDLIDKLINNMQDKIKTVLDTLKVDHFNIDIEIN